MQVQEDLHQDKLTLIKELDTLDRLQVTQQEVAVILCNKLALKNKLRLKVGPNLQVLEAVEAEWVD